ncbi:T9SS type A sorting domain-containing protein [Mesonia sp. MT50]|uniref:T9SS type A sorting domain-containing protein n=1 Tax=Mesonia profundi TaxID=3070998 RepID=A0ABU1A5P3_9FLAO|nr:T9SS type A sorting domain-containing protein [Mesonia profundi]MDQ7918161.1 T9SS type A sorting domain-containing protein [Mesonia profundi]
MTYEATLSNIPNLLSLNSIDYNNDGLEDLYTSYANHVSIFENDANQNFTNEISVYQDDSLIMGALQLINVDNQNGLDYVWSGGNNTIAFHMNESLLNIDDLEAPTILLYPNPTNGILNSTHQFQKLRIYNFQGAKLMEVYKTKTLDLSRLPAGIYTLIMEDLEGLTIHKIIKN